MKMSFEDYVLNSGLLVNPSTKDVLKKAALLAFVAASCACGKTSPLFVDVRDQPVWVVESFEEAADFWALHDIEVNVGAFQDGIKVAVLTPEEIDNDLARWSPSNNAFFVSENLGDIQDARNANLPTCSIAHEIGHAIGMDHVNERRSLMAARATALPEEGCWWSVEDQLELCRVNGCTESEDE